MGYPINDQQFVVLEKFPDEQHISWEVRTVSYFEAFAINQLMCLQKIHIDKGLVSRIGAKT